MAELLDPRTICYTAQPGKVATIRPREQLLAAGRTRGLSFRRHLGGVTSAAIEFDSDGKPSVIDYWDRQGRVCKTEFIGDRGAIGADRFTNLYEFNDEGRLVGFKQTIKKRGEAERLFRGYEYRYREGNSYTEHPLVHTKTEGMAGIQEDKRTGKERE